VSDHSFFNGNVPQFGTAEYARKTGAETCQSCGVGISDQYFRINGAMACAICANQAQAKVPKDTHTAFVRGITFGIGGAVVGLIVYAAFGILTGLVIGYVALAVGWIVGKAIKKGSNGIGGIRYQIAAVILTYAAVSLAAVPMGIAQYVKSEKAHKATIHLSQPSPPGTSAEPSIESPSSTPAAPGPRMTKGALIGRLFLLGLASPFLEFKESPSSFIALFILFIGLRIAWQLTDETTAQVLGPFKSNTAPSSPLSSP
jgi:hypothetical protein